jgi:hypothetical protein
VRPRSGQGPENRPIRAKMARNLLDFPCQFRHMERDASARAMERVVQAVLK